MSDEWARRPERSNLWVMQLYAALSLRAGRRVGRMLLPFICSYFLIFARAARLASTDYLTRVLGRPPRWGECYRHIATFASVTHDRLFLVAGRLAYFDVRIDGETHVRHALTRGRGLILLGAHFGSFEILRAGLATRDGFPPLNVLMYIDNAANTNQIFETAKAQGARLIPLDRPDSLLRAMECLKRGEMLGILGDRTLGPDKVVHASFFGELAVFPQAPWILAGLSEAPVVLFFGAYEGQNRYRILFENFADLVDVPRAERVDRCTHFAARYAERLEVQCRRAPFNWFNFYAFWSKAD